MRLRFIVGLLVLEITGCTGFGVQDAERHARDSQARVAHAHPPTSSIWSMFGSSREAVQRRLDPGLGKPKGSLVATFGQPFLCNSMQVGGEICGWFDAGMTDSGATESNQHQVFYVFDASGTAAQWFYRGLYGSASSLDAVLPRPPLAPLPPPPPSP